MTILVAMIIALTQLHSVDIWISDRAYDFASGSWIIDHANSTWRVFLYDGPKALLVLFGIFLIGIAVVPVKKISRFINRREAVFLLLCLAVVPGAVGIIRSNSGVSCPYSIERYGGSVADTLGQAHISSPQFRDQVSGCWPSGHVSGGFALLALAFLGRPTVVRRRIFVTALTTGTVMGVYQVLRGAHFASHILVTLCIAILLISLVEKLMPPVARKSPGVLLRYFRHYRPHFD